MSARAPKQESVGFGFVPAPRAAYHFVVTIPASNAGMVRVAEHFVYGEDIAAARHRAQFADEPLPYPIREPQVKVELSYHKWSLVAEEARAEFNRRLRTAGLSAGSWKRGENQLAPHLGKELTLLLWAIEHADPSQIPQALANWQGLAPEERWWLYTTINAASGHPSDTHGWRKAIRIAFTENPVEDRPSHLRTAPRPPAQAEKNGYAPKSTKRKKSGADGGPTLDLQ